MVGWLVRLDAPRRLRREVLGVIALAAAVLLALPLVLGPEQQGLIGVLGDGLRGLLGRGALLVPLGLGGLAIEAFIPGGEGTRQRRVVGYGLFTTAVVTFLHLLGAPTAQRGGGYLGSGFGELARMLAGDIGAGIIAFTVGIVGVYLLTGTDMMAVVESWRRLRAARAARRAAVRRSPAAPAAAGKQRRAAPPAEEPEPEAAPPVRPVINLPKPEPAAPRPAETKPATPTPAAEGGPARLAPPPLPDLTRLALYDGGAPDAGELERKAALIQESLRNFKVDAQVREIFPGPAVTMFTLEPGPGVKVRRITELQNDLALALATPSIRIEAPVPGMARVGIEVPNSSILTVGLRETIASAAFQRSKAKLPLALGRDVNGRYVVADLAKMPHLLIAGSTGSGKSVCINGIIATFLLTRRPTELQMVLIDPKKVELVGFNGVPHLKCPVVTDMDKVVGTLRKVLEEMERRYQQFAALGVRNIDGYNLRRQEDPGLEIMPYLVVIIDELADLMMTTPEEVETLLVRLAQMARATGIHLLIATQRPSVDVLTGLIKANVPARIAFAVTSQTDSRVILDLPGAERLLGKGDMLFLPPDAAKPFRVQGSFIEDRDLQYVVRHWRQVAPNHQYDPAWCTVETEEHGDSGGDPLLEQALQIVRQHGTASASMLQRRLRIGYNRAARLIEEMEEQGYIGPADGSRGRPVYLLDDDE
ncbi:MAG: DNA translocase FtsK [Sphaerobacter sp.]|nr:DNA translocase FtsK [Sphaerobacter sp.]